MQRKKNRSQSLLSLWCIAMLSCACCFADTVRVKSGDVDSLIAALREMNGVVGNVVELEAGNYLMPDSPAWTNSVSSGCGVSSLYVDRLRLRGLGERPEDVVLVGNGATRIIFGNNNAIVENLTITNGYAKMYGDLSNSNRGGGCYGKFTLTNSVVVGCIADGPGGGCQLDVRIVDSRISNNKSYGVGGGFHNCSAYDSVIEGNVSVGDGGGVYTCSELVDCLVVSNSTVGAKCNGGGCFAVAYATNCVIVGNVSTGNGAGASNHDSSAVIGDSRYVDCLFMGNVADGIGGGASRVTLVDCVVSNNVAKNHGGISYSIVSGTDVSRNVATNGRGGGVGESVISNCTVYANSCSNLSNTAYGGGVTGGSAYGCEIYGNYSATCVGTDGKVKAGCAGGVYETTLYDCHVHDNYADSYGGGIRGATAYRCVIANNFGGNDGRNAYASNLIGCDVSGSDIISGTAQNSVIHDVGVFELDNPYKSGLVATNYYVWKNYQNATNCLFRDNMPESATPMLFVGLKTADISTSIVNCTFVSNRYDVLGSYFVNTKSPLHFVNCVFYGNYRKNGQQCDIVFRGESSSDKNLPGAIDFDTCAYGTSYVQQGLDNFIAEGGALYQFGVDGFGNDPKFCGISDAGHPYSLRRSSPLRGIGKLFGWMDDATDMRGDGFARKRDGKVDLGCYQCWLYPKGSVFLVR